MLGMHGNVSRDQSRSGERAGAEEASSSLFEVAGLLTVFEEIPDVACDDFEIFGT